MNFGVETRLTIMMDKTLREMTQADLDVIWNIERRVHAHPWTLGNFHDALVSKNICLVYEDGGQIIGYAVLMLVVDEVQLLNISIDAPYQRQGLGMRLLRELQTQMRDLKMQRMLLEVRPSNTAARGLYEAAGFVKIGLRRGYYAGTQGREDAMVMECLL